MANSKSMMRRSSCGSGPAFWWTARPDAAGPSAHAEGAAVVAGVGDGADDDGVVVHAGAGSGCRSSTFDTQCK